MSDSLDEIRRIFYERKKHNKRFSDYVEDDSDDDDDDETELY